MIAVDTSTWIAYLQGDAGEDTDLLDRALSDRQVLMAPVVLTEVLSNPNLPTEGFQSLIELPLLQVEPGYWQRAGELRAKVLARGRKARLGDALIAQSCIDHGVPLVTRDRDFRAFAEAAGLGFVVIREKTEDSWPQAVLDLAGAWPDFPTAEELRANPRHDSPRESL